MSSVKHTEKSIAQHLRVYYSGNSRYRINNVFVFYWESDFFVLRQNGYICDYEIKITRSDYFADFKKLTKHEILPKGHYTGWKGKIVDSIRPNKFYFVVPKDLIKKEEVPAYAGLIYVSETGQLTFVKEAPFLHRNIVEVHKTLADKFYHRWNDSNFESRRLAHENKVLRQQIERLKTQHEHIRSEANPY